ncbi:MAG: type II toxin-antitoxin system VapC family toxin [Solirubrobacteraceae bacterium]
MSPGSGGWIVDASVALRWYLPVEREPDGELARAAIGSLAMRTTVLAEHEVGNILIRSSGWARDRIVTALGLLLEICGEPIQLERADHPIAVELALVHRLAFYDASYVAIARRTGRSLLSADHDLIAAGLAVPLRTAVDEAGGSGP